jgi:hypothetical protein
VALRNFLRLARRAMHVISGNLDFSHGAISISTQLFVTQIQYFDFVLSFGRDFVVPLASFT